MPARVISKFAALIVMLSLKGIEMRAAETKTNTSSGAVQVPFEIRRGAALVKAHVNGSAPLTFKLDTGFGVTTIHPDLVDSLELKPAGRITINGIAGHEEAGLYSGAVFDFAGEKYSPRRVAAIPSDARRPRRARDGILGASFFRRFVVELDPRASCLTLHQPDRFTYAGQGEIIPLRFRGDTPNLEAAFAFPPHAPVIARYEIDSGCDGALCLGQDFVEAHQLVEMTAARRNGARVGVGGHVETREGGLPEFQIGSQRLTNVRANFFAEGSPAGPGLAGHIGFGLLREFKVIFDYERRRLILERLP